MLKNIIKHTTLYSGADLAFKFAKFAAFPIFAHLLSVEDFGILALVNVLMELFFLFANCGLNEAVQRDYHHEKKHGIVITGMATLIFFSALITLAALLITSRYSAMFHDHFGITPRTLLFAALSVIPVQLYLFSQAVIRMRLQLGLSSLFSGLQVILNTLLCILFVAVFHWGVSGYVAGVILSYALTMPFTLYIIRHELTGSISFERCIGLLRFGYPYCTAALAFWIFGSLDRWMLADLTDTIEVSLYSIAFRLCSLLIFINLACTDAWKPHAMKLYHDDPGYRNVFSQYLTLSFFLFIVIGSGIALFGRELLMLLTPEEYWAASHLIPPIAMGLTLYATSQTTVVGILISKRNLHVTGAAWTCAAVNVLLNAFLIPFYGAFGAAGATLTSYALLSGYYLFVSQRLHPLPLEKSKLSACLLLCIFLFFSTLCLDTFIWSYAIVTMKAMLFFGAVAIGTVLGIIKPKELYVWYRRDLRTQPES